MRRANAWGPALLALALFAPAAAGPPPSLATYASRYGDAVLRLEAGAERPGGFLVATVGYAVTALRGAALGDEVTVELAGERRGAVVVRTERPGSLAILAIQAREPEELFPSLPLAEEARPEPAAWLVGLCAGETAPAPVVGGTRGLDEEGRWRLDLPCGPGAPVLDEGGRVVAITVETRGARASVGAGVERVRALARGLPRDVTEAIAEARRGQAPMDGVPGDGALKAGERAPRAPTAAPPAGAPGATAP